MPVPAVPVAITGIGWNSVLLALLNVLFGGVIVGLIRIRPTMAKLKNEREATEDTTRTGDMVEMRKRIGELEKKVDTASAAAHTAEMKLIYAVNAVQLLAAHIRAGNPDDPILKQASDLLAAATSGLMPTWETKLASGLDRVKGTGE